jgi:hypothetical protein
MFVVMMMPMMVMICLGKCGARAKQQHPHDQESGG